MSQKSTNEMLEKAIFVQRFKTIFIPVLLLVIAAIIFFIYTFPVSTKKIYGIATDQGTMQSHIGNQHYINIRLESGEIIRLGYSANIPFKKGARILVLQSDFLFGSSKYDFLNYVSLEDFNKQKYHMGDGVGDGVVPSSTL